MDDYGITGLRREIIGGAGLLVQIKRRTAIKFRKSQISLINTYSGKGIRT